ncbi:hypothetical protein LCGC14_1591320 [marine sediment metagenome]|uniref:Uncharacterized protein n=1 Tax=marine sediment metagenome TaxID=412755 RepID=A0A0F9LEA8_9ZZZZ
MENETIEHRMDAVERAITALEANAYERLRKLEAVAGYSGHKPNCPISLAWGSGPGGTGIKCECGYNDALAELEAHDAE